MKFPWDRAVKERLRITGHRIDAEAPPLRDRVPNYDMTGFQPSALVFPTEGCWEVTGRAARRGRADLVRDLGLHHRLGEHADAFAQRVDVVLLEQLADERRDIHPGEWPSSVFIWSSNSVMKMAVTR
jgi:hypothetical protein